MTYAIRLIDGLHLTATDKRHMAAMLSNGWTSGKAPRARYWLAPCDGRPGFYAFTIKRNQSDDWGRMSEVTSRGTIEARQSGKVAA